MAVSAILSIDVPVDHFAARQKQAQLQCGVIRLGKIIGDIDGLIGNRTQAAIEELGVTFRKHDVDGMLLDIENLLQEKYPAEYEQRT
jgi:hypothetical protein